ncbi:hypothetical protein [uncultured Microbacterium sp.]|uniref:hypothetical protein n=1 Tax=uncultured Microbacterium sp. TaxID=191216 RepID=UPI0025F70E65|nr:hypothetical protein [uncultured Microbacterium sp.]
MSEPKVAQDAEERGEGVCRTCLAPIWNEGGTIGRRKREKGWSDRIERGGDSLVCFKAVEYRHVPLADREAYIYDVALARGAGMTGEDFDRMLAARDADVRAQTLVQARQIAEVRAGVVAEEPEWEYIHLIGEPPIQMAIKSTPERATHKRIPRRVFEPGPWVPVKQEGAEE